MSLALLCRRAPALDRKQRKQLRRLRERGAAEGSPTAEAEVPAAPAAGEGDLPLDLPFSHLRCRLDAEFEREHAALLAGCSMLVGMVRHPPAARRAET